MAGARHTVGVRPVAAYHERRALLAAIEAVMPVGFVPVDSSGDALNGIDALLVIDGTRNGPKSELPTLVFAGGTPAQSGQIVFAASTTLDPRLRGVTVESEWWSAGPSGQGFGSGEVLASAAGVPVWQRAPSRCRIDVVTAPFPELGHGEYLRDRVTPGRCLAMIAVIDFLRHVCAGELWARPGPHASVILDDPNVRWRSYGYVNYAEVARDADVNGYHVSFAHVPLDFRFFDRRTVRLFQERHEQVSLAIHGNNHTHRELEVVDTYDAAQRLLAQALRRTSRFERRSGVEVSRVMIPPHEVCSEAALRAMPPLGYDAATMTRPYGWYAGLDSLSPYAAPGGVSTGFAPADVTAFGLPLITRRSLRDRSEIVLRAFLDQPIVLYGHEGDLSEGLDALREAARVVDRLPGATWCDLSTLCRSNYATRRNGKTLYLRPYARRLSLSDVPDDVVEVVVHPLIEDAANVLDERRASDARPVRLRERASTTIVLDGARRPRSLEIEFLAEPRIDPDDVCRPSWHARDVLRRPATEIRDRTHPLRDRLRAGVSGRRAQRRLQALFFDRPARTSARKQAARDFVLIRKSPRL